MLNIKSRNYDQLLNYKKYLSKSFKKKLKPIEKYLLAVRSKDPLQKLNSGGSANQKEENTLNRKKKILKCCEKLLI